MRNTTLCYITRGNDVLMLHRTKKEHDENRDKWIGVGGKFEDKESPEDCLLREVKEETGLDVKNLKHCGCVHWHNTETNDKYIVLFYKTNEYSGELLKSTDEGEVFFTPIESINNMPLSPNFDKYLDVFLSDKYTEIFCNRNEKMKENCIGEPDWAFQYR